MRLMETRCVIYQHQLWVHSDKEIPFCYFGEMIWRTGGRGPEEGFRSPVLRLEIIIVRHGDLISNPGNDTTMCRIHLS